VTALMYRVKPAGAIDVGKSMKLPSLPLAQVMLHANVRDARAQGVLRTLVAAVKNDGR
jgi:hypothetical protein